MKKAKRYSSVKFSPDTITNAESRLVSLLPKDKKKETSKYLKVYLGEETWSHDSESEFFADYLKDAESAHFHKSFSYNAGSIDVDFYGSYSEISVEAPKRSAVEDVFGIFEKAAPSSKLKLKKHPKESPTIFIGHGRSNQWRLLKDELSDKHGYKIDAYEIGARAGHAVRDVLERMVEKSSFAILVMTGEDLMDDGEVRARQNVIHEIGLFQGAIGFSRTIVLREGKTTMPSNIEGITYIPYPKGRIKETISDIIATINREFK